MKKIILYIASSLDGYIADRENNLDWLTVYRGDYGYNEFIKTIDTVLCGRKTYDEVVKMGVPDPYPEQMNYIFTSTPDRYRSTLNIVFTSRDPVELAKELQLQGGKNIFLVGGGDVISEFLENNLIDEVILFIVPIILGKGIPLFKNISRRISFTTDVAKKYDDGMIELRLKRK